MREQVDFAKPHEFARAGWPGARCVCDAVHSGGSVAEDIRAGRLLSTVGAHILLAVVWGRVRHAVGNSTEAYRHLRLAVIADDRKATMIGLHMVGHAA